jgi:ankyrin repeat protein
VNVFDEIGLTALHEAAMNGQMYILNQSLKKEGGNVNCMDDHGNTPLWWAIQRRFNTIVRGFWASQSTSMRSAMIWKRTQRQQ